MSAEELKLPPIETIRAVVPDVIENKDGTRYALSDGDRSVLYRIFLWTDEELEHNLYIMSPLEDAQDAEQEQKDLLKFLNMDHRIYTLMFCYATMETQRRQKEATSLKRVAPTKRKWRTPTF